MRPAVIRAGRARATKRLPAVLIALAAPLAACVPTTSGAPFTAPRAQAEEAALAYVAARDPIVDPAPVAACIARNASPEEATALAAGGEVGATVTEIVRRRSTQDCFAEEGVPDFGLDLLIAAR